jgi:hypothetical protein
MKTLALNLALLAAIPLTQADPLTYYRIAVEETSERLTRVTALAPSAPPRRSREVSQYPVDWTSPTPEPRFLDPIPFVLPPVDESEPFYPHNHLPSVAWLPNGDLMAI